ncbi:hypothetical protein [Rhodococcus aetherivorans]
MQTTGGMGTVVTTGCAATVLVAAAIGAGGMVDVGASVEVVDDGKTGRVVEDVAGFAEVDVTMGAADGSDSASAPHPDSSVTALAVARSTPTFRKCLSAPTRAVLRRREAVLSMQCLLQRAGR